MLEKIIAEYKEKMATGKLEELLKAPVYGMIITYLQTEYVDEDWENEVKNKLNSLDYLYETFNKNRHTLYSDVKSALDFDQLSY